MLIRKFTMGLKDIAYFKRIIIITLWFHFHRVMKQSLKELSTPYLNWHTLQINRNTAVNVPHVQKLPFSRDLILLLVNDHSSSNYHISGKKTFYQQLHTSMYFYLHKMVTFLYLEKNSGLSNRK